MQVVRRAAPPSGLVVVTGALANGIFTAENGSLSTKCPSKYAPAKKNANT
jgi:hypothetical protein